MIITQYRTSLILTILLPVFCVVLLGCSGESSPTIIYKFPYPTNLSIKGNIDLSDVAVDKSIGGTRAAFLDHSNFIISVQDDPSVSVSVDKSGYFELPPISIRDQVVLECKSTKYPGFNLEWMAADSNGLYGNKDISITIKSTARSLIARCLRDRYGRRIKPETLGAEHISTTVNAIANVLEQHPEKLSVGLEKVADVLKSYSTMADSLNAGNSGAIPNNWVYMIYMGGDNNLYSYLSNNLNELAEVGNISKSIILVQAKIYDSDMKRYLIKDNKINELASVTNADSSDPKYIADFVSWSKRVFPASHYALIISSHADAWKNNSIKHSLIFDQSTGNFGNPVAIAAWLTGANTTFDGFYRKLDLLAFDACFMGMVEIAVEFQNIAKYTIFSQARVPSYGFPYRKIFSSLKETDSTSLSALQLTTIICNLYRSEYITGLVESPVAISAINNEAIPTFLRILGDYISAVYNKKDTYKQILTNLRDSTIEATASSTQYVIQAFENPDYRDLKDFLKESNNAMPDVKIQADLVLNDLHNIIVTNYYSDKYYPDTCGISISIPASISYQTYYLASGTAIYSSYQFAQQTLWDELLNYINN